MTGRHRQRGIATLLMVLLVGLAVSVAVGSTVYTLKGAQSKQLSTHSVTAAQAAAWRGVEVLRQYLENSAVDVSLLSAGDHITGMTGLGLLNDRATVTAVAPPPPGSPAGTPYWITARVVGQAGGGSTPTTAAVEVVYAVGGAGGSPEVWACGSPVAATVFNGDLTYGGGGFDVVNPLDDMENIAVAGKLTVGGNTAAKISGCIKGDVNVSGGSITQDANIRSESNINISGSVPDGSIFHARNVTLNNVGAGNIASVLAGAYAATVYDGDGHAIGTADIGGDLIPGTVTGGIPWKQGTIVPPGSGKLQINLANGQRFLLDLSKVAIDASLGRVTGASGAEWLAGDRDTPLSDTLRFVSTAITGGAINQQAYSATFQTVWGYSLALQSSTYAAVKAAGDVSTKGATITALTGGGKFSLTGWDVFGITTGKIAGAFVDTNNRGKPAGLATDVHNTSPGLPGIPWCDVRTKPINVNDFKESANYVFEYIAGNATLTIQNVNKRDGTSINGAYALGSLTPAQILVLNDLIQCSAGTGRACITTGSGAWTFNNLTGMPPGILWFGGALSIGSGGTVLGANTVISSGNVTLNDQGTPEMFAPNFRPASVVCGGAYYPTNLCNSDGTFKQWTDAKGNKHNGIPLSGGAVLTEGNFKAAGWKINGNVVVGGTLDTSGALLSINGSLTVGTQGTSATTIGAGGLKVTVPTAGGHVVDPTCKKTEGVSGPPSASVLWSRYQ